MSIHPIRCLGALSILSLSACVDLQPPVVSMVALDNAEVYQGVVEIQGKATDPSGLAALEISVDGSAPVPLPATSGDFAHPLDTTSLPDGAHLVTVTATDGARQANRASGSLALVTDNTPPALEIAERSLQTAQGHVLPVFVRSDEILHDPKVRFLDKEIPLYALSPTLYRALFGVSVKQEAGTFPLTIEATDAHGNAGSREVSVALAETDFKRGGYIKLTKKQQANQKDDSKVTHDRSIREEAWAHVEPRQLWGGAFARPTEGPVSSPFGKYREYSSGVKSHHLGLDLSNETGTPVYAANDGVVLVADPLYIMGNHVVVFHGQGVASAYSHLSAIEVKRGDRVRKGQLVGLMGSTGQSTGPHLHWEVVVSGVKIRPELWEADDFGPPTDLTFR